MYLVCFGHLHKPTVPDAILIVYGDPRTFRYCFAKEPSILTGRENGLVSYLLYMHSYSHYVNDRGDIFLDKYFDRFSSPSRPELFYDGYNLQICQNSRFTRFLWTSL